MIKNNSKISEVVEFYPEKINDARGFFMECYQTNILEACGIHDAFIQENCSRSNRGVLRGLHYQKDPFSQGKLVSVDYGIIYDVAVDLRQSSSTFLQWTAIVIDSEKHNLVWVPKGFAHGFYIRSKWAQVRYRTTKEYVPKACCAIRWDDPTIGVYWPIIEEGFPILSNNDKNASLINDAILFD